MNWRYEIKIKHLFSGSTTPDLTVELCTKLVRDLSKILETTDTSNISKDSIDDFWYELEECRDNFDFLRKLADDSINKSEWEDYGFDGDYESWFNDYLEQLYDVADTRITLKNGEVNKLLWVG